MLLYVPVCIKGTDESSLGNDSLGFFERAAMKALRHLLSWFSYMYLLQMFTMVGKL